MNINGGDDTLPLWGPQQIVQQEALDGDGVSFIRTRKENLSFNLYFTLINCNGDDKFTQQKINEIGKFFAKSRPVEMIIEEDSLRCIKVVPTSGITLVRFGDMKGYFELTLQALSNSWFSPLKILTYDLLANQTFQINNQSNVQNTNGNYDISPHISIKIKSAPNTDFILNNTTTSDKVIFSNVLLNDVITLKKRHVYSELKANIFPDWNRKIFIAHGGMNTYSVNKNCEITVHLQYPLF